MSEEWKAYVEDPRTICKYGMKCYQKNPEHHKTYKHPPAKLKRDGGHGTPPEKRFKPSPRDKTPAQTVFKEKAEGGEINKGETTSNINPSLTKTNQDDSDVGNSSTSLVTKSDDLFSIKLPDPLTYHSKDNKSLFRELFLVEMPEDFFQFFDCITEDPNFLKTLVGVNLELIGPFDLLLGKLPVLNEKEMYLIHWRFFFDPPEFQAILKKKGKSEYHIGYFRDSPNEAPVFLASNDSSKGCQITPMAENIFGAIYMYLQNEKKSSPFSSMTCQKLMDKVKKWAENHQYSVEEYDMKKRLVQSVTKTLHGAGIVVPFNKKTELGYRKLVETDANLKKLFRNLESAKTRAEQDKVLSDIQPVITYASIAVDECDFGTGLECGIDLFCSGLKELQPSAVNSLQAVYSLLNREAFGKVIEVHVKYRRKGPNMSILSKCESDKVSK